MSVGSDVVLGIQKNVPANLLPIKLQKVMAVSWPKVSGRAAGKGVSGVGRRIGNTQVLTFELILHENEGFECLQIADCGGQLCASKS